MPFEDICSRFNGNYSLKELQEICRQLKLNVSGPKAQVTKRVVQYTQSTHPECETTSSPFVKIRRQINRRISNKRENRLLIPARSTTHQSPVPRPSMQTTGRWKTVGWVVLLFLLMIGVFFGLNDVYSVFNGSETECKCKGSWMW